MQISVSEGHMFIMVDPGDLESVFTVLQGHVHVSFGSLSGRSSVSLICERERMADLARKILEFAERGL